MEEGDDALYNDEAVSRSNAVYLEKRREELSDIMVVDTMDEEPRVEETIKIEETTHYAMRRTLWMVLIAVMIVVFLVVALIK